MNRVRRSPEFRVQPWEASETILVSLFQDSILCHAHAKRITLKPVDMALAMRICQEDALHGVGKPK